MVQVGDVVNYAKHEWYVIKAGKRNITLLAKNEFGKHKVDTFYNNYETSEIRLYLNSTILCSIKEAGGDPLLVNLSDISCTDKVWLLSLDEARKLPLKIRKFDGFWWWLRSSGHSSYEAMCVHDDGRIYTYGLFVGNAAGGVRPVIRIKAEELTRENKI